MVLIIRYVVPGICLWLLWRYMTQDQKPLNAPQKRNADNDPEIVDLCPDCGEPLTNLKKHKC